MPSHPSSATARLLDDVRALTGPQPGVADHPLVVAAGGVAARWAADAETVDQVGVDRARVDLAARAGLLGATAPVQAGGGGAGLPVARAITEQLAGACGTTWFVTAQHAMPLGAVLRAAERGAAGSWVRPLAEGSTLAAVAVSHVRRGGPPAVTARPDGDGWRVDGSVGWLTSWGLADVLLLAARAEDCLVMALLPAHDVRGASSGAPMRLAAMQGTRTTTMALDGLHVAAEQVLEVVPAPQWLAADADRTANVVPAVFGLLGSICRDLVTASDRPGAGAAAEVGLRAAELGASLREQAYRLLDEVPPGERVEERLRLRAEALHLLVGTSGALVAAWAGAAISLDHPAQRYAREALFHLVQAQTAPVRAATLGVWAERTGRSAAVPVEPDVLVDAVGPVSVPGRAPSPTR